MFTKVMDAVFMSETSNYIMVALVSGYIVWTIGYCFALVCGLLK
jgi:hypothetical protein